MAWRYGKTAKARNQELDLNIGKSAVYGTTSSRRGRSASLEPGALLAWSTGAALLAWSILCWPGARGCPASLEDALPAWGVRVALLAWGQGSAGLEQEGRSAGLEHPLLAWGTALPCWPGG